jgi:hypothetical protein
MEFTPVVLQFQSKNIEGFGVTGVKSVAWNAATSTLLASDFFNYKIRALGPPKRHVSVAARPNTSVATQLPSQLLAPLRDDDHAAFGRRAA